MSVRKMSAMLLPILLAAALLLSACASERKQDPALVSDDAAGITEIIRASRAGELRNSARRLLSKW